MKTFSGCSLAFFVIAILSLFQTGFARGNSDPPIQAKTCPIGSEYWPCACSIPLNQKLVFIRCWDPEANQTAIENAFREIRLVNRIPQDVGIHMNGFRLESSKLTELDMSPFYGSQIDSFTVQHSDSLTKIVTSGKAEDHGSIHVNRFYLEAFPMSREGFGDILKYFSNEMTDFQAAGLFLYEENISGEFLPGVSAHTNLKELSIYRCNITGRLDSDTWIPKELQNLQVIDLTYNNISEIGENVFDFYDGGNSLEVVLKNNKLTESSFHPNSGISRAGRRTTLDLWYNQISSLPAPIFQTFLDAHPQNEISLFFNPLICDERLSWLKSRRDELQDRAEEAYCSNDSGHTVFDSDLIP